MDLFGRNTDNYGGSFAADNAKLVFPGIGDAGGADIGMLSQQLQCQYSQQISKLYEIGSSKFYYVAGRTQGQLSINRVEGPRRLGTAFLKKFGNVCNVRTNNLSFQLVGDCGDGGGGQNTTYTSKFVVIQAVTIAVAAQDMLINNGIQAMFSSFSYE